MLFEPAARFKGLPQAGFEVFAIPDRDARRRTIIEVVHPALELLGEDLVEYLNPRATRPLHSHLPRLDWPRGYQPFCTWLALSHETQGYQASAQLNIGVHADQVILRLGWDTSADAFGRFEFLCRHTDLGGDLAGLAAEEALAFRVFSAAEWPKGSALVFESADDVPGSFDEVARRGVWWELGRRHRLPRAMAHVCSPGLGEEAREVLGALLPVYERIAG